MLKRAGLGFGLAMTAALALCAFAAGGSAAATQHWAGATQVPYGSPQEFSGKATSGFTFSWEYGSVEEIIDCESLSTSGTVKNLSGGGAGTVNSKPLQFGGCSFASHPRECAIENGEIDLSPLSETTSSSGKDQLKGASYRSSLNIVDQYGGGECFFKGSYVIWSSIAAEPISNSPGRYQFTKGTNIQFEDRLDSMTLGGLFTLSTPSGEPLVLSSEASLGAPHWYFGSAEWSTLSSGTGTAFHSSQPVSFELESEPYGGFFDLTCAGSANSVGGSLENPSGGGAGTVSASFTLDECSVRPTNSCVVEPAEWNLSGVATQVGKAGSPAAEFSLPEGSEAAMVTVKGKAGHLESCPYIGEWEINGNLIATSEGDGRFDLGASEVILAEFFPATVGGGFALESEAGKSLRLQA